MPGRSRVGCATAQPVKFWPLWQPRWGARNRANDFMKRATAQAGAPKTAPARDIDEYLAAIPGGARAALEKLRKTIRAAAPRASEVISYQIPAYKLNGKLLVSFAAHKNHCGFYVMSPDVMWVHAAELKKYDMAKGSIRFPADQPLPAALVTRLVKARIAENEKGMPRPAR